MADKLSQSLWLGRIVHLGITIPANTETGEEETNLRALIAAAITARMPDLKLGNQWHFKVVGNAAGGTSDRDAFHVLGLLPGETFDDALFNSTGEIVPEGNEYEPPIANDGGLHVRSLTGAAVATVVRVII